MRKTFVTPGGVGAGILDRYPCDGLVIPTFGIAAILPTLPAAQKVVIVLRVIVGRIQEFTELGIGYGRSVDIKTMYVDLVPVETPRNIFPRILHIRSGIVAAFNFDAAHFEVDVSFGNMHHSFRR